MPFSPFKQCRQMEFVGIVFNLERNKWQWLEILQVEKYEIDKCPFMRTVYKK